VKSGSTRVCYSASFSKAIDLCELRQAIDLCELRQAIDKRYKDAEG
jgi:hypothetical protein